MSRIFMTGSKGFFGTRFESVFGREHDILGVDVPEVDIVDEAAVNRAVSEFNPDLVIHAAAITSTSFSDQNPDLTRKINVDGAVHVAKAAKSAGAQMIFFSTEQVFNGNAEAGPYNETDQALPNTMYGKTKLEAEAEVREIIDDLWILRFTWLFGLPERNMPVNPNILWNTVQLAVTGRTTPVATNEFRGHTYGYDMIDAVMKVRDLPYDTYHIGSRTDLDRFDLTCHVLRELGLGDRVDDIVEADHEKYKAGARDVRLDTTKISSQGITFDESPKALTRALEEFHLTGAFADPG